MRSVNNVEFTRKTAKLRRVRSSMNGAGKFASLHGVPSPISRSRLQVTRRLNPKEVAGPILCDSGREANRLWNDMH